MVNCTTRSMFLAIAPLFFGLVHSYHQSSRANVRLVRLKSSSSNFDGYRQSDTKTGAYEIAASSEIRMPCIILVNPYLDQNVGSVSRAMVNANTEEKCCCINFDSMCRF